MPQLWYRRMPAEMAEEPFASMSAEQLGWFGLLCDAAWQAERQGYLPSLYADLAAICRTTLSYFQKSERPLMSVFQFSAGVCWWPPLLEQVEAVARVSRSYSERGKRGGRPRLVQLSDGHVVITSSNGHASGKWEHNGNGHHNGTSPKLTSLWPTILQHLEATLPRGDFAVMQRLREVPGEPGEIVLECPGPLSRSIWDAYESQRRGAERKTGFKGSIRLVERLDGVRGQ